MAVCITSNSKLQMTLCKTKVRNKDLKVDQKPNIF